MTTNNRSMFPYRRGTGKRRGKSTHPRRGGGPRRPTGSAAELLSQLQPTTKALAQMLAGNTKASGQLVHARNILEQAQRMIEDRIVDRMQPHMREEFLEQVARLRLTLADADFEEDDAGDWQADQEEEAPEEQKPVSMDRLRELARSLATAPPVAEVPLPADIVDPYHDAELPDPSSVDEAAERAAAESKAPSPEQTAPAAADEIRTGRSGRGREKLRLKPVNVSDD